MLVVLVWWLVPPMLYHRVAAGSDAQLKAITDTRTALLAGLIGLGAVLAFWLHSRADRNAACSAQAQAGRRQVPQGSPACLKRRLSDAVYRQLLAD